MNSTPTRQTSSSNSWSTENARMAFSSSSNNSPGGFVQQVLHVQHQPFLRIQFFILPLHLVEAVGEQHHKVAGRDGGFAGLIRRVFKQAERGLAPAGSVGERLDARWPALHEQRLGMAGVGEAHDWPVCQLATR